MLWELLSNLTIVRGILSKRWRHLRSINELVLAGRVILGVFFTFLIDSTGLRQMAGLSHLLNYLQVPFDLIRRGQTDFCCASADLHIQVFIFIANRHFFAGYGFSIEINPLVVKPVKVARDVFKTLIALFGLW